MKKIFSLLAAVLFAGAMMAEEPYYTLVPTSGSNTGYASNCDIVVGGITWNLTGNSQMDPWRIGGKSLSGVNRELYSKTPLDAKITKIEIEHGAASSVTVNSLTVIVASDENFANVISTLTPTFAASSVLTVECPEGKVWNGAYYKFVYNLTVSSTSNKFVEFVSAKFYGEESAPTAVADPKFSLAEGEYEGAQSVEISCKTEGATIYYTLDGTDPTTASAVYSAAIPVAATTTIKAFAAKADLDNSAIVSATYTIIAGADVVLDFTDNTAWQIPVGTTKTVGTESYTNGDYTITLYGPEGNGYYFDDAAKNILVGKEGAYLQLPAFADKVVSRIVTTGVATGAAAVTFNVFDGEDAVSTEVTSCKVDQKFDISSNKKNVGYIIKITNANNARFAKIKIWFGPETPTAIDNAAVESKAIKTIENGKLVIIKNGVRYSATGARL